MDVALRGAPGKLLRLPPLWGAELDRLQAHWKLWERLEYLLEEYGDAIEYDLQVICHVDLATALSQGRVRNLLNLIDHLPSNSYYFDARAQDERQARYLLEHPELEEQGDGPQKGAFANWTSLDAKMADLIDLMQVLISITRAVGGDKHPPAIKPYKRPVPVIERVRKKLDDEAHDYLVSRVLIQGVNDKDFE